jgi:1,4-alpha-glucan branching enzyme
MYDTELFGHWWSEGPEFVAAALDRASRHRVEPVTAGAFLRRHGARRSLQLPEGSWGAGGRHRVWLQPDTLAGWRQVHEAERRLERVAERAHDRDRDPVLDRLLDQAGREVMLLEASDWPFLITTGAARDYAEARIAGHAADASRLLALAEARLTGTALADTDHAFLATCERRDPLFPEFDWRLAVARGAPAAAGID